MRPIEKVIHTPRLMKDKTAALVSTVMK